MGKDSDKDYNEVFKRMGDPLQQEAALADLFALCRHDFIAYIRRFVADDESVTA